MKKLILKQKSTEDTYYDFEVDGAIVGNISIKHTAIKNFSNPKQCSSYLYYEIYENHRRNGYGYEILKLGLEKVKERREKEILLTCYPDNLWSKKVIEFNGGIFAGLGEDSGGNPILKYCFKLG